MLFVVCMVVVDCRVLLVNEGPDKHASLIASDHVLRKMTSHVRYASRVVLVSLFVHLDRSCKIALIRHDVQLLQRHADVNMCRGPEAMLFTAIAVHDADMARLLLMHHASLSSTCGYETLSSFLLRGD